MKRIWRDLVVLVEVLMSCFDPESANGFLRLMEKTNNLILSIILFPIELFSMILTFIGGFFMGGYVILDTAKSFIIKNTYRNEWGDYRYDINNPEIRP